MLVRVFLTIWLSAWRQPQSLAFASLPMAMAMAMTSAYRLDQGTRGDDGSFACWATVSPHMAPRDPDEVAEKGGRPRLLDRLGDGGI